MNQMNYYVFHLFIILNLFTQLLFLFYLIKLFNNIYNNIILLKIKIYMSWLCIFTMSLYIFRITYINYSIKYSSIMIIWKTIFILMAILLIYYIDKYSKAKKEVDSKKAG